MNRNRPTQQQQDGRWTRIWRSRSLRSFFFCVWIFVVLPRRPFRFFFSRLLFRLISGFVLCVYQSLLHLAAWIVERIGQITSKATLACPLWIQSEPFKMFRTALGRSMALASSRRIVVSANNNAAALPMRGCRARRRRRRRRPRSSARGASSWPNSRGTTRTWTSSGTSTRTAPGRRTTSTTTPRRWRSGSPRTD